MPIKVSRSVAYTLVLDNGPTTQTIPMSLDQVKELYYSIREALIEAKEIVEQPQTTFPYFPHGVRGPISPFTTPLPNDANPSPIVPLEPFNPLARTIKVMPNTGGPYTASTGGPTLMFAPEENARSIKSEGSQP